MSIDIERLAEELASKTSKRKTHGFYLDADIVKAFAAACGSLGVSPSKMLERLMRLAIDDSEKAKLCLKGNKGEICC